MPRPPSQHSVFSKTNTKKILLQTGNCNIARNVCYFKSIYGVSIIESEFKFKGNFEFYILNGTSTPTGIP